MIELGSLNGTLGAMIEGRDDADMSGRSGGFAGDLNADGTDDVAVGSPGADPLGRDLAGETDVLYGRQGFGSGGRIDLAQLNATDGCRLFGARSGDRSGSAILGGHDLNGDGWLDLVIGAPIALNETGQTFVLWGGPKFCPRGFIDLASLNKTMGCLITGWKVGDRSGSSFAARDFEGRGFASLVIGAPYASPDADRKEGGQTFVLPAGPDFCAGGEIQLSGDLCVINGMKAKDHSGYSLATLRGINADQRPDLVIGAPDASPADRYRAGQTYVLFGGEGFCIRELADLDGVNGAVFNGEKRSDQFGFAVAEVDNFTGSGFSTFFSGAYSAHAPGRDYTGKTYSVFGGPDFGGNRSYEISQLMDGIRGVVFVGTSFGEQSGSSVAGVRDFSGDGVPDALIGAYWFSPSAQRRYAGRAYGVFGHAGIWGNGTFDLRTLNGSNGVVYNGISEGDRTGLWVSYAGDLNFDGFPDGYIGAAPTEFRDNGYAFAVFGRGTTPMTVSTTSALPTSTYGTTSFFNSTAPNSLSSIAIEGIVLGVIFAVVGVAVLIFCGCRSTFSARPSGEGEPNPAMGCADTLLTHRTVEKQSL